MLEKSIENAVDTREEYQPKELMKSLLRIVPPGTATLEATRNSSGLILQLEPSEVESATFGVHYDGCVDVFFGRFGTTFELPRESGLPKHADFEQMLGWAKDVGLAAISGKCRERAGLIGARGTVEVRGKPYRMTSLFHFRLLPQNDPVRPVLPRS